MPTLDTATDQQLAREQRFLRRFWWVFPLAGLLLAWARASWGWYLVTLNPADMADGLRKLAGGRFLLVTAAVGVVPLVWWLGMRFERRLGARCGGYPLAAALAVILALVVEAGARSPWTQFSFWLAVRARCTADADSFAGEVSSLRLDVLNDVPSPRSVVIAGTSQVIWGLDGELLARLVEGRQIKRRAAGAMVPYRACAAQDYLAVHSNDVLVLYVSEFDMAGIESFDTDWFRPLAGWTGTKDVLGVMPIRLRLANWRRIVDLAAASSSELWRMRDYIGLVLGRLPAAPARRDSAPAAEVLEWQSRSYRHSLEGNPYYDMSFGALERLIRRVRGQGVTVLVLEGRINPVMMDDTARRVHEDTRRRLQDMADRIGFAFVPEDRQDFVVEAGEWVDGTHFSGAARERFTRYLARELERLE